MTRLDEVTLANPDSHPHFTDHTYKNLLSALMCNDPGPNATADATLRELVEEETRRRGWESWIIAYHEFDPDDAPATSGKR